MTGRLERLRGAVRRLRDAARQYGESPLVVAGRATWARCTRGINFERGLGTGLYDPRIPPARRPYHVASPEFRRLRGRFNEGCDAWVDDKTLFAARCQAHGLAMPPLLAVADPPRGLSADGRSLHGAASWERFFAAELPAQFVVKPAASWSGQNVEVFAREGDGFRRGDERLSLGDLRRRIVDDGFYGRAVIQERLHNHAELAAFSPAPGLQTVRVLTVVSKLGEVVLLHCYLKMILDGSDVDNYRSGHTGNLVLALDPTTGVSGKAYGPGPERIGIAHHLTHPRTGRPLAGWQAPDWPQALALVRSAALRFLPQRAIGWDLALTPKGPALIEGNTAWGPVCPDGPWFEPERMERMRALL